MSGGFLRRDARLPTHEAALHVHGERAVGVEVAEVQLADGARVVVAVVRPRAGARRALAAAGRFPPLMVHLIASGEATGALADMLNAWYGRPSEAVKLVGITGTNGKTTTASLLYELFTNWGFRCGLISTVQYRVHDKVYDSSHTTPDIIRLYGLIDEMVKEGCTHVFMEVSSHAVDQERIRGLKYAGAVFTNITPEHMDYHRTFSNYIAAKKKFFDGLSKDAFAVYNADDPNGSVMVQNTAARKYGFGIRNMADYKGKILDNNLFGLHLSINRHEVHTRLIGEFNAYNLVCVYAVAELLGQKPLLDLGMRLGEASGAAMAVPVLRAAVACHTGMATFDEAGVSDEVK